MLTLETFSFPRTQNKVNFDPRTKNLPISVLTQKPSWFRFRLELKPFSIPTQEPSQFHPYPEIKSSSIPDNEIKSISTTLTKIKLVSVLIKKTFSVWHVQKNEVNVDPSTKNVSISVLTLKPS